MILEVGARDDAGRLPEPDHTVAEGGSRQLDHDRKNVQIGEKVLCLSRWAKAAGVRSIGIGKVLRPCP